MAKRITGLETEYGCLVSGDQNPRQVVEQVRDWFFQNNQYGLLDLHDRDWDESAGNGGFLFNGGRVYIDMGHLEYCTPECASALDVVHYDRAGDRLLQQALRELDLADAVSFIRNNIDHHTGATFGCHENYSLSRMAPLTEANVFSLLGFLTIRMLLCGAGRVGVARRFGIADDDEPGDHTFQISQRADYIQNDFYEWVQHNRAIINTRDEPLADPWKYRRIHLIHGDTNVLPASVFLKVGTTRLALDLLEEDALPAIELEDAVSTMRMLSRNPDGPWRIRLRGGDEGDAVELLEACRQRAQSCFGGRDAETDAVIALWGDVVNGLGGDRNSLVGLVDWVTKRFVIDTFREEAGLDESDPWLESQDLEYHQVDPDRCLARAVENPPGYWATEPTSDVRISPPVNTRARARSLLMRNMEGNGQEYVLDWESVARADGEPHLLLDPFEADTGLD